MRSQANNQKGQTAVGVAQIILGFVVAVILLGLIASNEVSNPASLSEVDGAFICRWDGGGAIAATRLQDDLPLITQYDVTCADGVVIQAPGKNP